MLKLLAALLAAGKVGKLLTTGGTMLLSIVAYAFIFGWWYAVGFVGAWIELKDMPHDVETEAYVGMAGPIVGTGGALACYLLARSYDSPLLLALSYAGFFINLFNLIPLSPFDGGRVTAVLSPRMWLVGVPILIAVFFWRPSPILILVALLAAPQVMKAIKYDPKAPENIAYYSVSPATKIGYGTLYVALAAYLAVMTHDVHEMLEAITRGR